MFILYITDVADTANERRVTIHSFANDVYYICTVHLQLCNINRRCERCIADVS